MATRLNGTMGSALARDWWVVLLRGVVAVVFGIAAFVWPGITLIALVFLFGIYAIVDGILAFGEASSAGRQGQSWIWPVIVGVAGIAAGVIAFALPGRTAIILLYIIAIWAIVTGVAEFISGIALRREIDHQWLLMLGGVISVLFGILVFARPGAGALALVWLIGFYAVVIGIERIGLAFEMRRWQEHQLAGGMPGTPHPA